jgi:hypothetical protein
MSFGVLPPAAQLPWLAIDAQQLCAGKRRSELRMSASSDKPFSKPPNYFNKYGISFFANGVLRTAISKTIAGISMPPQE